MSDEQLDRLIDDVARQMTRGQLSSDFRARVIGGLDRRPRRAWRPLWILAPLGTLAAAILVILVARGFQPRDRGPESAALRQNRPTVTVPSSIAPDIGIARPKPDTTFEGPRQGTHVAAGGLRQHPPSAAAEVAALAPPPLEVQPLGVEAIGIDALPTGSIAVPQLDAIAPIGIAPLPSDEERPCGANEGTIDGARLPTYRLDYRLLTTD
jgi:hypothetical protein